ncbi:15336_t:CDS:2 [Gigaspora rosea]|nr:15336_t:CDS:2 [Gigaspora rosea]
MLKRLVLWIRLRYQLLLVIKFFRFLQSELGAVLGQLTNNKKEYTVVYPSRSLIEAKKLPNNQIRVVYFLKEEKESKKAHVYIINATREPLLPISKELTPLSRDNKEKLTTNKNNNQPDCNKLDATPVIVFDLDKEKVSIC